jgi:hypothetical protein
MLVTSFTIPRTMGTRSNGQEGLVRAPTKTHADVSPAISGKLPVTDGLITKALRQSQTPPVGPGLSDHISRVHLLPR